MMSQQLNNGFEMELHGLYFKDELVGCMVVNKSQSLVAACHIRLALRNNDIHFENDLLIFKADRNEYAFGSNCRSGADDKELQDVYHLLKRLSKSDERYDIQLPPQNMDEMIVKERRKLFDANKPLATSLPQTTLEIIRRHGQIPASQRVLNSSFVGW